jgi:REP element-mobilizing transposase RayT
VESDGRKHPTHPPSIIRHNTSIIVFLTVCTKDRKPILANESTRRLLHKAWQIAPPWLVGRYVIMPDHVHVFCAPARSPPTPLAPWVRFWKSQAAQLWPDPQDAPIWQRDFWDSQLRRGENYHQKWEYVLQNPVRAGLVARPEDWPYQGELNILSW